MMYHTWGWEVGNPLRPISPDSPELTNLVFQSGSIEFEANEWKTVISSDCLQQNDGHNCGIFVILNLAAMFIGN